MHFLFSCLLSPSSSSPSSPIFLSILKPGVEHIGINGSVFFDQRSPCGMQQGRSKTEYFMLHLLAVRGHTSQCLLSLRSGTFFKLSHSQVTNRSTQYNRCSDFHRSFDWLGITFYEERILFWLAGYFSPFYFNTLNTTEQGMLHVSLFFFLILSLNYQSVQEPWMFPGEGERREGKGKADIPAAMFCSFPSRA